MSLPSAVAWCAGPAAAHAVPPPPDAVEEPADLAHLRAARAAVARGHLEEAVRRFDDALLLSPGLTVAHLGRMVCLAALARAEEAAASLRRAHEACDPADLALHLSRLAARRGDDALAMDLLSDAVRARPEAAARVLDDPAYLRLRDHPRLLALVGHL